MKQLTWSCGLAEIKLQYFTKYYFSKLYFLTGFKSGFQLALENEAL